MGLNRLTSRTPGSSRTLRTQETRHLIKPKSLVCGLLEYRRLTDVSETLVDEKEMECGICPPPDDVC